MVSINEIAEKLGMSRNTVSKAINGKEGISQQTRDMVLKAAIEMGYKKIHVEEPKGEAAAPIVHQNISVLVNNPEFSQFWMQMINSIASELTRTNNNFVYNYIFTNSKEEFVLPAIIANGGVSGVIVINIYDDKIIDIVAKTGLPTVYYDTTVNATLQKARGDIIITEGEDVVCRITRKLIEKGLDKIGFIGDITYSRSIYERFLGYKKALEQNNLEMDSSLCILKGTSNYLYDAGELELCMEQLPRLPQAFVCANDIMAYRAIEYLKTKGINTPEDILVSGYDNIKESLTKESNLTTVNINVDYIGKRLVKQLLERIGNPSMVYEYIRLFTAPIFRRSTGHEEKSCP